eukprot:475383_1
MDIARMENKTKVLLLLNNFIKNNCKNAENLNDFPFNEAKRKELKREYDLKVRERVDKQAKIEREKNEINEYKSMFMNDNEDIKHDIEVYDELFEKYYMIELRKKFGFLDENNMHKVMEIRTLFFDRLQRTCCDYTNAFRNLNMFSIYGVNEYDDTENVNIDVCMKQEDNTFLEYILSQCATVAQYKKLGYRPRLQSKIKRFEMMIKNNIKFEDFSMDEMKELLQKLKNASVLIYNMNYENKNDNDLMYLEIEEITEIQKKKRDKILWIRFIKKYRQFVNEEYSGSMIESFDNENDIVDKLRGLNNKRIDLMNSVNAKYILRNYLMEQAIQLAKKNKDYSMVNDLLNVIENPFEVQHKADINDYTCPVPLEMCGFCVSCAS